MATQSWSSRVRHDSDATFREWGSELAAKFLAAGLVQTADTGQVNWVTVTRPGTSTFTPYEIWRFNDAQQTGAPIFIKVEYGTLTVATHPGLRFTVGTGSNGSGTLTGTALTSARIANGGVLQTSDVARQSYLCVTEGFLGLAWKVGAGISVGAFIVTRTVDSSGSATATGALVHWGSGSATTFTARQALRFASPAQNFTAQTSAATGALGINPQSPTSTAVGGDIQAALGITITPRAEPLLGICGVLGSELAPGGTFSATLVGASAHTYLTMPDIAGPFGPNAIATDGGLNMAILWE